MQKSVDTTKIVEEAKTGDELAFKALYEQYWCYVLFICSKLCRNEEDAKEILQDTFFKAFRNIHQLKDNSKFKAWLSTLATRECYSYLRKKRLPMQSNDEVSYETFVETDEDLLPEAYLEKKGMRQGLFKVVDNLPSKQREAIYLYYYVGIDTSQIAELQSSNQGSVVKTLHDARKNLRKRIGKNRGEIPAFGVGLVSLRSVMEAEGLAFAAQFGTVQATHAGFCQVMKTLKRSRRVGPAARIAAAVLLMGAITAAFVSNTELMSAERYIPFLTSTPLAEPMQPEAAPYIPPILADIVPTTLPETMPAHAETVVAVWGNEAGYFGIPDDDVVMDAAEVIQPSPAYSASTSHTMESGWTFLGWTEDVSNLVVGQPAAGNFVSVNPETMPPGALTLFAVWGNDAGYFGIPNTFNLTVTNFPAGVNPVGQTPITNPDTYYDTMLDWHPGTADGWTFLGWTTDVSHLIVGQPAAGRFVPAIP